MTPPVSWLATLVSTGAPVVSVEYTVAPPPADLAPQVTTEPSERTAANAKLLE